MSTVRQLVFSIADVPFLETPDGSMRDSFMLTEETCGATGMTAGLLFVHPHSRNRNSVHEVEEIFFIVGGRGRIMYDGQPQEVEAGDLAFMPAHVSHCLVNDHDDALVVMWVILTKSSDLGEPLLSEMCTWKRLQPNQGWSPWPCMK